MKHNLTLKIFLSAALLTLITFALSSYAINRVIEEDPQVHEKIQVAILNRYDFKNFNINISSNNHHELTKESDAWKFDTNTQKISITAVTATIEVLLNKDENLFVKADGLLDETKNRRLLDVAFSQSQLKIKEWGSNSTKDVHIKILIPKSYKNSLEIVTVNGDINVQPNLISKIKLASVSGNITLEENLLSELDIGTVSGDVKLGFVKKHEPFQFKIKTLSGDVSNKSQVLAEEGKLVSIETVSGNVEID